MDVNEELKFLRKFTKKSGWRGSRVSGWGIRVDVRYLYFFGGVGLGGGCEQESEVFVIIQKNFLFFLGGREVRSGVGGGGGRGIRVDVNEELKFL